MLKLSHKALIVFSGIIWLAVGSFLLSLGLNFLLHAAQDMHVLEKNSYPLLNLFSSIFSNAENIIVFLIALGLIIGYSKGRYVLGKAAVKGVERIYSLPNPTYLQNIYDSKYYILLAGMMGLGFSMKYLGIPADIRGLIDVAIGSALINGAMIYFRLAFTKPLEDRS
ncbi:MULTISPECIES: hypothetical protein [unclassified Neochlamydia]|uniref:hypothetical protein n=1 Tax=unclassified Neochlamydia TaxID=2643326 RepID=UPI001BCA0FD9|nr:MULTISPECIES: hypothetical protein [unclassified Neochlamydia]MBS4165929.1 Uncharacterized protein [Neochlamydia sp. AcF65]MBS4170572.1 Uncharacterized protein [Neochlamydia sp. AcF95]